MLVPDRHGATAWKHWIFCLTDHLDFENLENRRRYHNPGKPRTAGLCGREVVASDHLPLSSTFFGWPKPPDLTHKTAAAVPLPIWFFLWRYPRKTPSPTFAHTGPTRPAVSQRPADAIPLPKSHTVPDRPRQTAYSFVLRLRFVPFLLRTDRARQENETVEFQKNYHIFKNHCIICGRTESERRCLL